MEFGVVSGVDDLFSGELPKVLDEIEVGGVHGQEELDGARVLVQPSLTFGVVAVAGIVPYDVNGLFVKVLA